MLAAIADRIFPPTDTPGAVQAGAVDYILQALAGPYRPHLALYRSGLQAVDRLARAQHGMEYVGLSLAEQDALLEALEAGKALNVPRGAEFFAMMREHVLEGVFCEPSYGGNRDLVGWRIVGFPGQRTGYPDAYIDRVVDLPAIAAEGHTVPDGQQ
jgi:gluconate 2-dehydrogenase gamma chain